MHGAIQLEGEGALAGLFIILVETRGLKKANAGAFFRCDIGFTAISFGPSSISVYEPSQLLRPRGPALLLLGERHPHLGVISGSADERAVRLASEGRSVLPVLSL